MTSNLTVASLTGGTVFHIHGFDDGVAAEFTFHIQQRTLDIMLTISVISGLGPCLLYTSPSPRDKRQSRMPSSA